MSGSIALGMLYSGMPNGAKQSGIYAIHNRVSGVYYIGASERLEGRFYEHRRKLNSGTHVNSRLQRAWRKYGPDAFDFIVMALMPPDAVWDCERRLLSKLVGRRDCYNVIVRGKPRLDYSPVARAKMGAPGRRRRGETRSPEMRAKIAATLRGRKLSPEHIEKVRIAGIGRRHSPETRAKMAAASAGKRHTPETRAKMSARKKENPLSPKLLAHLLAVAERRRGTKHRPETIAKMRAAKLGKPKSAETRAKMRARVVSPETRERLRQAQTGKTLSEETRAKLSMAKKGRPITAEHRAKLVAANIGRVISPETRAKISAANRGNLKVGRSSRNHRVTAFGETKHLAEWARDPRCQVKDSRIRKRLKRGWSPELAITSAAGQRG